MAGGPSAEATGPLTSVVSSVTGLGRAGCGRRGACLHGQPDPLGDGRADHGAPPGEQFGPVADSVYITSGGLRARPGIPMEPYAADELDRLGVAVNDFTSRGLDRGTLERAHLVLTATRRAPRRGRRHGAGGPAQHLHLAGAGPAAHDVQPAALQGRALSVRVANIAELAVLRRGHLRPLPPEEYDVVDPMGGLRQTYRRTADQIDEALTTILAVL